jgi:DNA-binding HxlR family transcriptional regulator
MSLIGGAWTPNVLWCLSSGPRRFGELRTDMPPISAKVLSTRLHALEEQGVIVRRLVATSPRSAQYELTDLGRALLPAINAIVDVGKTLTT